jgi:hypothetical protein
MLEQIIVEGQIKLVSQYYEFIPMQLEYMFKQLGNKLLFDRNCERNFLLLINLVKHDLALKSSKAELVTIKKCWLKLCDKLFKCDKILLSSKP